MIDSFCYIAKQGIGCKKIIVMVVFLLMVMCLQCCGTDPGNPIIESGVLNPVLIMTRE